MKSKLIMYQLFASEIALPPVGPQEFEKRRSLIKNGNMLPPPRDRHGAALVPLTDFMTEVVSM